MKAALFAAAGAVLAGLGFTAWRFHQRTTLLEDVAAGLIHKSADLEEAIGHLFEGQVYHGDVENE